ncbi:MAG: PASTA domain-containing protein [Flavobacteriales bacterium]|nr:PASTA domain-containing protein [Flavobacteriales bacterium]MCX7768837.1 PASTA domain-containing protein [Flavobacteriales bacterium]MDW8410507.1 PASTA domain-containing protein [Flavobacteriales bacterium]
MAIGSYFSRQALKHWVMATLSMIATTYLLFRMAGCYTRHDDVRTVPDVKNMYVEDAEEVLDDAGLVAVVSDSTYQDGVEPGAVLEQNPEAGSQVKKNRKVYLIINSSQPPLVPMPDLRDLSKREAIAILETRGLKVGKIYTKPGFGAVLDQLFRGMSVPPGMKVRKGLEIDLVIGTGTNVELVPVPNLSGLSKEEAIARLAEVGLSLGFENYEPGIVDSSKVKIVRQYPAASAQPAIPKGETVDIWYGKR